MMKYASKTLFRIFLVLSLQLLPKAYAGIEEMLEEMYQDVSTSAQSFNTEVSGGLSGGSYRLRVPAKAYNLIAFSPPRASMGCNGIDLFGGSFEFINSDELEALLRQILAQGVNYAFKMAVSELCKGCAEVMNEIQHQIQELNLRMKDTCSLASSLASSTMEAAGLSSATNSAAQSIVADGVKSAGGWLKDELTGLNDYLDGDGNMPVALENAGNILYKALRKLKLSTMAPSLGSQDEAINFVLSVVGSVVIDQVEGDSGSNRAVKRFIVEPLLTFDDIVKGANGQPLKMYNCVATQPDCGGSQTDDSGQASYSMPTTDYTQKSFSELMNEALFSGAAGTTIVDCYSNIDAGCNFASMAPMTKKVIGSGVMNYGAFGYLRMYAGDKGAVEEYLTSMKEVLTQDQLMAMATGVDTLLKAAMEGMEAEARALLAPMVMEYRRKLHALESNVDHEKRTRIYNETVDKINKKRDAKARRG